MEMESVLIRSYFVMENPIAEMDQTRMRAVSIIKVSFASLS